MALREFLALLVVCTLWGLHFLVLKVTVNGVAPPFFYAAMRMSLVAIILLPKLKWHSGQMKMILGAGLGFGAFNYVFMFPALTYAPASIIAIGIELYVPFSIILAVIFLKERIGIPKLTGIILAFCGVAIMTQANDAHGEVAGPVDTVMLGVFLIALAGLSEAFGALFVKQLKAIGPLQMLSWFAVIGAAVLWPMTLIFEDNQWDSLRGETAINFVWALGYSALLASIVAHATYYWLLGRLPIYMVASSGLLTTFIAVTASVLILKEPFTWPLVVGGGLTLVGVGLIQLRVVTKPKAQER